MKIAISSDTVVTITYTKRTPIISLGDIYVEREGISGALHCVVPLQVTVTFPEHSTGGWHFLNMCLSYKLGHVIKDGADLFVADQVGIVHAARLRGNLPR